MAMSHGVCKLIWIKRVMEELKIQFDGPKKLYCDNKSKIIIANNHVHHDLTKHVEVDRYFIREKVEKEILCIKYVPTSHHFADLLINELAKQTREFLIGKLGLINIYIQV